MDYPQCPKCQMDHVYIDESLYICPDCGHEWSQNGEENADEVLTAIDANGNTLVDGDTASLTKSLKVKGSSLVLKQGTVVKNIRIVEGDHNIDCKINGTSLQLKSEFMKKN